MRVILTEKVKTLGNVGEIVNVSPGYARNYIIPQRLGVLADESNTKVLANQQRRISKKVNAERDAATAVAKELSSLTLEFSKRVGSNGKLFGTITNTELSKVLAEKGIDVERRVLIVETPIKSLGSFAVKAKLFPGVEGEFKVKVVMDQNQAEEIRKKEELAMKRKAKKEAQVEAGETTEEGEATEATAEEQTTEEEA